MSFISEGKLIIPVRRRVISWNIPGEKTRRIRLPQGEVTAGRTNANNLVIKHETVSRRHARLRLEGDTLFVEDLASTQGTWIGNRQIKPYTRTPVPTDGSIWMGQVELKYEQVQQVRIPLLWLGGIAGVVLLFVGLWALVSHRNPPSASFTCQPPATLIAWRNIPLTPKEIQTEAVTTPSIQETSAVTEAQVVETPEIPPLLANCPAGVMTYGPQQFMDLPFPYTGTGVCECGTDDQFQRASNRNGAQPGGRLNSFFDHKMPIYLLENPDQKGSVLLFTGEFDVPGSYSGHAGYDYSPKVRGQSSTPVCAAADGWIEEVSPEGYWGNHVIIRHEVEGVGVFKTIYGHLETDHFFSDMLNRKGQPIKIYERIGTMGNTGNSTGHHLHFEVRYLMDDIFRAVDPYGYFPSAQNQNDPWYESQYLWIHPYPNTVFPIPYSTTQTKTKKAKDVGGESLPLELMATPKLCLPPNAVQYGGGGKLFFSLSLSPPPALGLVNIGQAITFSAQDDKGNTIVQFGRPITVTIPYDEADLENIDPESLQIRWLNEQKNEWDFVSTDRDLKNGIVGAYVLKPGQYALFGKPTDDRTPPVTVITAEGEKDATGDRWCDDVKVTITTEDAQSRIGKIYYSLKTGSDWFTTEENPFVFTLQDEGTPEEPQGAGEDQGDSQPAGRGRFLVQAYAEDSQGNVEVYPVTLYIVIDPNIQQCVRTSESSSP